MNSERLRKETKTAYIACLLDAASQLGVSSDGYSVWRQAGNARQLLEPVLLGHTLRERDDATIKLLRVLQKSIERAEQRKDKPTIKRETMSETLDHPDHVGQDRDCELQVIAQGLEAPLETPEG